MGWSKFVKNSWSKYSQVRNSRRYAPYFNDELSPENSEVDLGQLITQGAKNDWFVPVMDQALINRRTWKTDSGQLKTRGFNRIVVRSKTPYQSMSGALFTDNPLGAALYNAVQGSSDPKATLLSILAPYETVLKPILIAFEFVQDVIGGGVYGTLHSASSSALEEMGREADRIYEDWRSRSFGSFDNPGISDVPGEPDGITTIGYDRIQPDMDYDHEVTFDEALLSIDLNGGVENWRYYADVDEGIMTFEEEEDWTSYILKDAALTDCTGDGYLPKFVETILSTFRSDTPNPKNWWKYRTRY